MYELVHVLKNSKGGAYQFVSDLVVDTLKNSGMDEQAEVAQRIEEYAQQGVKLTQEEALEEIVAESVPVVLSNREAMKTFVQQNRTLAEKIRDFFVEFAKTIEEMAEKYFWQTERKEVAAMPLADTQELTQISEALDYALSAVAEENAQQAAEENAAAKEQGNVQFSTKNGLEFATDKYYERLLDRLNEQKTGGYIRVGEVKGGSVLNQVGLPAESLYFDVSKIQKALLEHSDHLTLDTLKEIPAILRNPVVVAEARQPATVNVFGDAEVNGSPVMVGVVVSLDRAGRNVINKVRTVHARRDIASLITDETVLYLSENKKRTREWFQARDNVVLLGGTRFGIIRSIADAVADVNPSAEISQEAREFSDVDTKFSLRKKDPPQKTLTAYKVFVVFENKPGQLFPPMVANPGGASTPVGVWLDADEGVTAKDKNGNEIVNTMGRKQVKSGGKGTQGGSGALAYRPGWHLGELPMAKQFARLDKETGEKDLFPANFVWAVCEIAADRDYQDEAMSYGCNKNGKFQHSLAGLPRLPADGYSMYRTNPDPTTLPWYITGAMKVTRILSDAETDQILREHGIEPMKRQGGPIDLAKFGLRAGDVQEARTAEEQGDVKFSLMSKREYAQFYSKVGEMKAGKSAQFHVSPDGDYVFDIENKRVYTDGKWQDPGIQRVI